MDSRPKELGFWVSVPDRNNEDAMGKSGRPDSGDPANNSGFGLNSSGRSQALFHETLVKERRKFERYFVEGTAYASLGPDFNHMGHIVDISLNGLAFSYVDDVDGQLELGRTTVQLKDNQRVLCSLPFESISDTDGDLPDPYSSVEIRYHRGRFGRLTRKQARLLKAFLKKRTAFGQNHGTRDD